jgi:hypothetical protein
MIETKALTLLAKLLQTPKANDSLLFLDNKFQDPEYYSPEDYNLYFGESRSQNTIQSKASIASRKNKENTSIKVES